MLQKFKTKCFKDQNKLFYMPLTQIHTFEEVRLNLPFIFARVQLLPSFTIVAPRVQLLCFIFARVHLLPYVAIVAIFNNCCNRLQLLPYYLPQLCNNVQHLILSKCTGGEADNDAG